MATFTVKNFADLEKLIKKHNKARLARSKKTVVRCAKHLRRHIIENTLPIASRELERSIHVTQSANVVTVVADAPHAEAVEKGSRPHTPPIGPLIEWVTLRGMQGSENAARGKGRKRHVRGTTTEEHSTRVHKEIEAIHEADPNAFAVMAIARAIQHGITKNGTKPQWFMRSALPEANEFFDREFRIALADQEAGGESSATAE